MENFLSQTGRKIVFVAGLTVLSSVSAMATAGDTIFSESFNTEDDFGKWTIVDNNGGRTWEYLNGAASYMLDYQTGLPGDDWLISPAFQLDGSKVYQLEFRLGIASRTENLRVALGTSADPSSFTTVLADYPNVKKADSGVKTVKLYVKASGTFRLGFYAYSEAQMHRIDIDDVKITEVSVKGVPAHVDHLRLTPGDKGGMTASLSFVAPQTTAADETLARPLSIDVYRNDDPDAVKTFTAVAPADSLTWTDEAPRHGFNTYKIVTRNEDGQGETAKITDFIGLDAPQPVTSLKARLNAERGVSLSWQAPQASASGGYVDFSKLKYYVYRGQTKLGEAVADTFFVDNNPVDSGQALLSYQVEPVADSIVGQTATSGSVVAGVPLPLPYHESFAHESVSSPWSLDADVCDFGWQLMPDDEDGEYEEIVSQDHDGGILRAESKTADQGAQSRYISPLLDLSTVGSPVLTFWFNYARSPWYDPDYDGEVNDNLKIQVSDDAGEWQDVENATFYLNDNSNGWTKCEVHLPRQQGQFTRIGLLATADAEVSAWRNIYIDNITVDESAYANDLALDDFTVDHKRVGVGDTVTYTATVYNRGAQAVSDYTVRILRDGETVATLPGVSVEPARKQSFAYEAVATLDDAQAEAHVWTAEVDFAADELSANNTSDSLFTSVRRPDMPVVTGLAGAEEPQGGVRLSWTAAQSVPAVEAGDPVSVTDDFESYAPFIIDGIGDWTVYDGDKATTLITPRVPLRYAHEGEPMAFQVFNNEQSGTCVEQNYDEVFEAHSGKQYLICPSADYPAENDDWLISPRLDGRSQTISFWAHSATYDLEWLSLWYSDTDNHHDSFKKLSEGDHLSMPERWRQVSFTVPDGARYFAIRCVRRSVMLFVDDVQYNRYDGATAGLTLKGYHVYRDGKKLTEVPVTTNGYTDSEVVPGGTYTYKVTAVYAEGESDYSAEVTVSSTTSVGSVAGSSASVTGRYNLAGQKLGHAAHGLTIQKLSDGTTRKVLK